MAIARKFRSPGGVKRKRPVKLTPPSGPFVTLFASPGCLLCGQIYFLGHDCIDRDTCEAVVQHGDSEFMTCPNRGKKFRFKLHCISAVEVSA